ncbi:hypothetical protein B4949_17805 [Vibrio cholerae]|nr:hypothetical protein [Vibrio cholerae]
MVSVVVFEFSGLRCQPLRRALCNSGKFRAQSFGFLRPFVWCCRQMSFLTLKFVVHSSRKTDKVLCLPQSVLTLARCEFCGRKVWKGQVYRAFCTC